MLFRSLLFVIGSTAVSLTAAQLDFGSFVSLFHPPVQLTSPSVAIAGSSCPSNPDVVQYRGIRYASAGRWQPPVAANSSMSITANNTKNWNGAYYATSFPNDCAQQPAYAAILQPDAGTNNLGAEDCQFLNVYARPKISGAPGRAVMVFFHGGAFVNGAGRLYDGCPVVGQSPWLTTDETVVVTVNYRLGIFGLLAADSLEKESGSGNSSGTYWFQDQQMALKWVKNNIAAFGGDPTRIAIWGESAGADSVAHHIASPSSKGLFNAAILESYANLIAPLATCKQVGLGAANTFGCVTVGATGPTINMACMRAQAKADLLSIANASTLGSWFSAYGTPQLPLPVEVMIANKNFSDVPVIMGFNGNEGNMFTAELALYTPLGTLNNATSYVDGYIPSGNVPAYITAWYHYNATSPKDQGKIGQILTRYPAANYASYGNTSQNFQQVGDIISGSFNAASVNLARVLASHKATNNIWLYQFTYTNVCYLNSIYLLPAWAQSQLLSAHAIEIPWTWSRSYATQNPQQACSFSFLEGSLSVEMIARFRRVVASGGADPNFLFGPIWAPYNNKTKSAIEFYPGNVTQHILTKAESDADFFVPLAAQ